MAGTPDRLADSSVNRNNDLASYRVVSREKNKNSRDSDEIGQGFSHYVSTTTQLQVQSAVLERETKSAKMKSEATEITSLAVSSYNALE